MINYSVCAIVKNEEKNIQRFLESLQSMNCEIIILDTGSTDKTLEIASKYPCKIYHFDWINDFSAARNYASSLASNDWVLFIDCDEFVTEVNPSLISAMTKENPDSLGMLERVNLVNPDTEKGSYTDRIPRLFNRNLYEYMGKIHEQVVSKNGSTLKGFYMPLKVVHTGYLGTPEEIASKHNRNMSMLTNRLKENPGDCYYNYQMGQEHYNQNMYLEAIPYFKIALSQDLTSKNEYHRVLIMSYCDCLLLSGNKSEALSAISSYEKEFGDCSDFYYLLGLIQYNNGDLIHAMSSFIKAKVLNNPHKEGTNTYLPTFYIAMINEVLGNIEQAITFYKDCGDLDAAKKRIEALESL